ncbi:MAG: PAS domain S-box protein [Candidatus Methanomethylicus sp.]|nr:PAS domain S-box protein [Candidatus Methanomethylicus sp.]
MDLNKTGLFAFIVLLILVTMLSVFNFGESPVFESPTLLLVLNFSFLTLVGFIIAGISAKSYLANGSINLLFLGMATAVVGLTTFSAPLVSQAYSDYNYAVAVHNTGIFLSGMLQFLSAFILSIDAIPNGPSLRKKNLLIGYLVAFASLGIGFGLILLGHGPAFFTSSGPTLTRQWVLGSTILLYASSSLMLVFQYRRTKSLTLYWYSLGLALFALALYGTAAYIVPNAPFNWLARLSQMIASLYFLMALLAIRRVKTFDTIGIDPIEERWGMAFKNAERRIPDLFSQALNGIAYQRILTDYKGKPVDYVFLDVNDAFEKQTGLKRGDVIGKRATKVLPGIENDPAKWIETYGNVALTGKSINFENYAKPLGQWYSVSAYCPRKGYFVTIFQNINERKQSEEKLKSNEALLRSFFDSPGLMRGIVEVVDDKDIRHIKDNLVTASYIDHKQQDLEGKLSSELGEPAERIKIWLEHYRQSRHNGQPVTFEYLDRQGSKDSWLNATVTYLGTSSDGNPQFAYFVSDTTAHRKVEEDLRRKQVEIQTLLENTPAGLVLFDATPPYKVLAHNRYYQELFAEPFYSKGMVGLNIYDYATAVEAEGVVAVFDEVARTKQPKSFLDFPYKSNPPNQSWFNWHMSPLILDGKVVALVSMTLDVTNRHLAEDALRESEKRLKLAQTLAGVGTWDWEIASDKIKWSEELFRIFGLDPIRVNASFDSWRSVLHPDDKKIAEDRIREAMEKRMQLDSEYRIKLPSGKVRWIKSRGNTIFDEENKPLRMSGICFDITERRETEDALSKSKILEETSYYTRNLIEVSPDPLVTINVDGKITDVNKATEVIIGRTREKLIGSDFSNYFTEPEKARAGYKKVFADGIVKNYPLEIKHISGKTHDVLYNASLYRDKAGNVQGVFAAARDITESKKAEMKIREQADLLDNANDAFILFDLENRVLYWNKGAERLYGWKSEEVLGKDAAEVLKNDPKIIAYAMEKIKSTGKWMGEISQRRRDGSVIMVESRWSLAKEGNEPIIIMGINTDITEKKTLESQYLRAQRLESIGTLSSGIAHDMRNILTPIVMGLDILSLKLPDEKDQELINSLQKNLQRASDLTKQMLVYAKGVEVDRNPLKAAEVVNEIVKVIKETFPKSISVETKIAKNVSGIEGDSTQLHQVLLNIGINARDAMPNGGKLTISASNVSMGESDVKAIADAKIGEYVCIEVSDTGAGITPEVMERIFEPFFSTKKPGEGSGLGLATARSIVKSHGGFIGIKSKEGEGASFQIYLPAVRNVQGQKIVVPPETPNGGNGQTILVVDDEELIRSLIKTILEKNNYRILEACDGAEAIKMLMENVNSIKLIILDMIMPIMSGEDTLVSLRKIQPSIKIIGMSGLAGTEKYKSLGNELDAFITKPFTSAKLLEAITNILSRQ